MQYSNVDFPDPEAPMTQIELHLFDLQIDSTENMEAIKIFM